MREAMTNDRVVVAGPDSPEEAICPACGGAVRKRKRRKMDRQVTYFYRDKTRVGEKCPNRYHP